LSCFEDNKYTKVLESCEANKLISWKFEPNHAFRNSVKDNKKIFPNIWGESIEEFREYSINCLYEKFRISFYYLGGGLHRLFANCKYMRRKVSSKSASLRETHTDMNNKAYINVDIE